MAGINQGTPEVAVGEPVRLGDNGEYELEHDPVTDRLIVRDTVNGTEAYVRPETNGQIGNQGTFIRSLVNSEPLADDGRTYSTVQEAERNANGWVFVPPGTFTENVLVETESLTIVGAGYGSRIAGQSSHALDIRANDVTIRDLRCTKNNGADACLESTGERTILENLSVSCSGGSADSIYTFGEGTKIIGCEVPEAGSRGIRSEGKGTVIKGCITQSGVTSEGIKISAEDIIVANNVVDRCGSNGISGSANTDDCIVIGNRIISVGGDGIDFAGSDNIFANNRISDSAGVDIDDNGTGTLLDANLTGSAN